MPPGAIWSQATIHEADGTKLHADILRPSNLPPGARTPVILSIGPYFNHSGQESLDGAASGLTYSPVVNPGPSDRFTDFVEGAHLMERGYAYVMVDLRGFGGSTGCLDWGGPGEQADVVAAVEWAARQPWSTGKVGMYGKSYDAMTGLMGLVNHPQGLAAVVAQEPVYDDYDYLYTNGVRFANAYGTPALYDLLAATPGPLLDSPAYNLSSLNDPACLARNWLAQQNPDHAAAYWRARDFAARAGSVTTPLFLTQGFLEDNTKPDGAFDFWSAVRGPKRAWFGMWDHVRGNDVDAKGRLKMGRRGFFDEVMRFYDAYLKGVAPTVADPPVAVETSDGTWRSEDQWPPADAHALSTELNTGSYTDDDGNTGTGAGSGDEGIWTFSPPLAHDAHLAGVPTVSLDTDSSAANANLVVDVYDVDASNRATLISRSATLLARGPEHVAFELYGNDWLLPAGHRLGVLVSSSNSEWWLHSPTFGKVALTGGSISLPFLTYLRPGRIEGGRSIRLDEYLSSAPFAIPAPTIDGATTASFALPPALVAQPSGPPRAGLTVQVRRSGHRLVISGRAPVGARVTIALRRGTKLAARRTARATGGRFQTTITVRQSGRYRATVTTRIAGRERSARSGRVRVP